MNQNKFGVWHYSIGLICVTILFFIVNNNYDEYVSREYSVGTKIKMFKFFIQKLDNIGGPTFVYGFLGLITMFFVYKIVYGIRNKRKDKSGDNPDSPSM